MDGLAHHVSVGIGKKPGEQRIETVRQLAEQPRGFHPVTQAFFACFADHRVQDIPRGFQVLSLAGLRQKGDYRRADREVREIAKLLYDRQRIDMSVVAQKKQGFGADTEFRVSQCRCTSGKAALSPAAERMAMAFCRTS